jgi:hypothetical protein
MNQESSTTTLLLEEAMTQPESSSHHHQQQHKPHGHTNHNNHHGNQSNMPQPFVLCLTLDARTTSSFTSLRTKYFPKHRNHLPSHLTFFHALPASHLSEYKADLSDLCSRTQAFPIQTGPPFRMNRGVGVEISTVHAAADGGGGETTTSVEDLHARLGKRWREARKVEMTAQDKQSLKRPHITIQNKVEEEEAKESYEAIKKGWKNRKGDAVGFELSVVSLSPLRRSEELVSAYLVLMVCWLMDSAMSTRKTGRGSTRRRSSLNVSVVSFPISTSSARS